MKYFTQLCWSIALLMGTLMSGQTVLVENLSTPYDVLADEQGDIYISDTYNNRILKTDSNGSNSTIIKTFGSPVYGILIHDNQLFAISGGSLQRMNLDGTDAEIIAPANGSYYVTAANDGYIYYTNQSANNIQRVKKDGTEHSTIITGLNAPMGITYDPVLDLFYYAEMGSDNVFSIKKDGTDKKTLATGFNNPHNLRLDSSGNLYIADAQGNVVKKLSADRKVLTTFPNTTLNAPTATFITKNGRVLISDAWGNKIRYVDAPAATTLNFDGVDDYISGTNALLPQGANEVTIEAVIKAPSVRSGLYTYSSIFNFGSFSQYNRFCLLLMDGNLTFMGDGHGLVSDANLFDDEWHHVAVTYKNNYIKLYVDGEIVKEAVLNDLNIVGTDFQIGSSFRNWVDELYEGDIDEIRVWSRALSQNELKNNKSCEVATPNSQEGLVSYFKFNQGNNEADNNAVTTLLDETGNSTSVILNNFALSGTKSNWLLASPIVTGNSCPQYVSPVSCTTVTLPSNGVATSENPKATWTTVSNANSYKVYIGTSSGNYNVVNGTSVTTTNYTMTGLSTNTTYFVKIVPNSLEDSAFGCSQSSFTTGGTLAVVDAEKTLVSLYPNPFTNIINLNSVDNVVSVSINDNSGKLIKIIQPAKELNLSHLSQGLYIINLRMKDGKTQSIKIIKK